MPRPSRVALPHPLRVQAHRPQLPKPLRAETSPSTSSRPQRVRVVAEVLVRGELRLLELVPVPVLELLLPPLLVLVPATSTSSATTLSSSSSASLCNNNLTCSSPSYSRLARATLASPS